jgi:hypothetical protein
MLRTMEDVLMIAISDCQICVKSIKEQVDFMIYSLLWRIDIFYERIDNLITSGRCICKQATRSSRSNMVTCDEFLYRVQRVIVMAKSH